MQALLDRAVLVLAVGSVAIVVALLVEDAVRVGAVAAALRNGGCEEKDAAPEIQALRWLARRVLGWAARRLCAMKMQGLNAN